MTLDRITGCIPQLYPLSYISCISGTVKREDVFITTKLWNTFHEREDVIPALKKSLENFGLDYVDLYLIHWPVACKNTGFVDINVPFKVNIMFNNVIVV